MQTAAAYPLPHRTFAAAPPRSGFIAYVRGFTLTVWLFTMLFRMWWISDWFALQALFEAGFNQKEYFYYGLAVAVLGHLSLGPQPWLMAPFTLLSDWTGRLFTIFCLMALCLAPMSRMPTSSGIYAVATFGTFVLLSLFWCSNFRVLQRVLVMTGMVLFAWLFALLARHGLIGGFGGQIGGINRNVTSTAALAAMICMLYSPKKIYMWAAFACAFVLIVVVSSRGSILAMGVFLAVYHSLHKGTFKALTHAFMAIFLAAMALLAFSALQDIVFEGVFRVSDKNRGVGSGFTGRVDMWKTALEYFWKKPVFGYGFRTSSIGEGFGGVHSAYLKILLEVGFVGIFFIVAAAFMELVRRLKLSIRLKSLTPDSMPGIDVVDSFRVNAISCAALCMLLTLWIYDQYYINLGSPVSIVFFLVLVAPTFITSQGVTLRKPEVIARRLAMTGAANR